MVLPPELPWDDIPQLNRLAAQASRMIGMNIVKPVGGGFVEERPVTTAIVLGTHRRRKTELMDQCAAIL
jgi:hypothetical protein